MRILGSARSIISPRAAMPPRGVDIAMGPGRHRTTHSSISVIRRIGGPDVDELAAHAAAAAWSICYAARCQLQMLEGDPAPGSPLDALQRHGPDYLPLQW